VGWVIPGMYVAFDESAFPGCDDIKHMMSDEDSSGESYYGCEQSLPVISDDDVSLDGIDESESSSKSDDDIPHSDDKDPETTEDADYEKEGSGETFTPTSMNDPFSPMTVLSQRYPQTKPRRPTNPFMASSVHEQQLVITTTDDPSLTEILSSTPIEYELWMKAIDDEFKSVEEKNTYEIDDDINFKPLPTYSIPKIKRNSDGTVEHFKRRLVSVDIFQVFGKDFTDTYVPVDSLSLGVFRLFLSISLQRMMYREQLDAKTAFLNGKVKEDIWAS